MARKPRIEYPGAVYHVTARGNSRADIFKGDEDRADFLDILENTVKRTGWLVYAYCLMSNHYHLLIETPQANLGKGMQLLSGTYTARFNRRRNGVGHVFQGRYKAILIEKESHLLEVARYVAQNPVRARIASTPVEYAWSSYRATIGKAKLPEWLKVDDLLCRFGRQLSKARKEYAKFVEGEGVESPFKDVKWGIALGNDQFLEGLKPLLEESVRRDESARYETQRPELEKLFEFSENRQERNAKMVEAHDKHGYTLEEIGRALGLHFTSVSRAMKRSRNG